MSRNSEFPEYESWIGVSNEVLRQIPPMNPTPQALFTRIIFETFQGNFIHSNLWCEDFSWELNETIESVGKGQLDYEDVGNLAFRLSRHGVANAEVFRGICETLIHIVEQFRQDKVKPKPLGAVFRRDTDIK